MLPVRMLTVGLHLLVSLVAIAPAPPVHSDGKLASTYEEAACDLDDAGECAFDFNSILPPAAVAILDCNDARTSVLLADMIGTCDMPRRAHLQAAPPTVHPVEGALPSARMSDGPRGTDSCPLRSPPPRDDSPSLVNQRAPLAPPLVVSSLPLFDSPLPLRAEDLRLDRPPRA